VAVDLKEYSRLTATIFRENLVFNYATEFYNKNQTISPADKFELNDEMYTEFKDYVLKHEFTYSTASEEMLKKMKETAEDEGFFIESEAEYNALLEKVVPSKERDLEKFKPEIKRMLENEIISRYYFQRGRAVHAFKDDLNISKSIEILNDLKSYNTILGK